MRVVLAVVIVFVGTAGPGCDPADPAKDRTAPRVLAVAPSDPVVAVDVGFAIQMSEAIVAETVDFDPASETLSVALVPRSQVSDTFVSDFEGSGALLASRQLQLVPIDVDVSRDAIEIAPLQPLAPRTAFTLLLSSDITDLARNPLVDGTGLKATFRYDFQTDDGQPAVVGVDVAEDNLVAPNRRRIVVTFNQPVQNVGVDTVSLVPAAVIDAVLLDEDRSSATILLGTGVGCARLQPSTAYSLALSAGILGDTGQRLAPFATTFTTGGACDAANNLIVDGPDAIAGELAATLSFETNKASTTEVRFGLAGGPLDCLGASCPVLGSEAREPVPSSSPPRFLHSVEVAGLQVDVSYDVVVSAEDDVGNTATSRLSFVTAPLPKVGLNEVMANAAQKFSPEAKGEYVELNNFGDISVDVSGWLLLVEGGDEGGGCTALLPDGLSLAPGAFVVVAGKDFDAVAYDLGAEIDVVRLLSATQANGMCGLVNSRAQRLLLTDSDGRPVSSISGFASIVPDQDGRSIERTAPDAADVEPSFCFSRADAGPTPGRTNSIVVAGCDNE